MQTRVKQKSQQQTRRLYRIPLWHTATGRWSMKIGKRHGKSGHLTDAWFYWVAPWNSGICPAHVTSEAVAKQQGWEQIVADWSQLRPHLEAVQCFTMKPDGRTEGRLDYTKPVWIDRAELAVRERATGKLNARIECWMKEGIRC